MVLIFISKFFFLPDLVIILLVVKWWFSNSIIPSICLNWHYFLKKFSSSHLYPWLWTHWFPFVVIHYYHYSLWSSSYPKFSQWESLLASPIVFWMCLHCLITSLLSEWEDVPGSLYTHPMPGISQFSKKSSSLHSGDQQSAEHRVSKPRGSTNGVYVVPALNHKKYEAFSWLHSLPNLIFWPYGGFYVPPDTS